MINDEIVCYHKYFIKYDRAGEVSRLSLFGFNVYKKVGSFRQICGLVI